MLLRPLTFLCLTCAIPSLALADPPITLRERVNIPCKENCAGIVTFSPDGTVLAFACNGRVELWAYSLLR